jgi:hypothetical protein
MKTINDKGYEEFEDKNLSTYIGLRIFNNIDREIEKVMALPFNFDRWDNKSHFIRCAINKFIDINKVKRS